MSSSSSSSSAMHAVSRNEFSSADAMQSGHDARPVRAGSSHGLFAVLSADSSSAVLAPGVSATEAFISSKTRIYLRDVLDHISTCIAKVESCRDLLNNAYSNHMGRTSLAIAENAEETNKAMRRFSLLAAALLPFSVLGGIWGMNTQVPFQGYSDNEYDNLFPFFCIVLFALVISVTSVSLYLYLGQSAKRKMSQRYEQHRR